MIAASLDSQQIISSMALLSPNSGRLYRMESKFGEFRRRDNQIVLAGCALDDIAQSRFPLILWVGWRPCTFCSIVKVNA